MNIFGSQSPRNTVPRECLKWCTPPILRRGQHYDFGPTLIGRLAHPQKATSRKASLWQAECNKSYDVHEVKRCEYKVIGLILWDSLQEITIWTKHGMVLVIRKKYGHNLKLLSHDGWDLPAIFLSMLWIFDEHLICQVTKVQGEGSQRCPEP